MTDAESFISLCLLGAAILAGIYFGDRPVSQPATKTTQELRRDAAFDAVAAGLADPAASPEAHKIAAMIAQSDPKKWEMEGDHCHYHGNPKMSFTYPDYPYYRSKPSGLYMGARDTDMISDNLLFRSGADEMLINRAIKVVNKRIAEAREIERQAAQRRADAERKARVSAFMSAVEK